VNALESQNNVPATMLESSLESWRGTPNLGPKLRHSSQDLRDKLSNFSPPKSPSLENQPNRQDTSYYSINDAQDKNSELDADTQARQVRARERLEILRARVFRTRRLIKDRRDNLRQLRSNVRDAAAKLTRQIDEALALQDVKALESFAPYYQQLRIAQDELGPKEEEYDAFERRLDDQEQDLEQEEDYFYRHNKAPSNAISDAELDEVLSPLLKPYQPPENEFQSFNLENELVKEYLEKVGEAKYLKEQLDELDDDYYRLSKDASFRNRHNIPISLETTTFLENFTETHKETLHKLHDVEDDLFDLRDRCLDKNLFAETDYVYEERDALYEEVMDSVDEARDRSPLVIAARHINYHEPDTNFDDKREYVNNWLLQWVQDSAIESARLRAYIYFEYPDTGKQLRDDKWPELALRNWDKDEAGVDATESFNASKMDTIAGNTGKHVPSTARRTGFLDSLGSFGSSLSLHVDLDAEGRTEAEFMGSETGSYATQREVSERTPTKQRPSSAPPMSRSGSLKSTSTTASSPSAAEAIFSI
jgi:hypothetical protein